MRIGVIGLGIVGNSLFTSFELKNLDVKGYDKYKLKDSFEEVIDSAIIFLCLPTPFDDNKKEYDKDAIHEICSRLIENSYSGIVVLKSTVEPGTTNMLGDRYNLKFVHNPEFLSTATAFEDFHNQSHIVIGRSKNINDKEVDKLINFYNDHYPLTEISVCECSESESMKIFCNSFYSVKLQFFNELYLLCQKNNVNYNVVRNLMLKNGWINKLHTQVPGVDGKLSYGGACFPKDTNALLNYMIRNNSDCEVLRATIEERNKMRE